MENETKTRKNGAALMVVAIVAMVMLLCAVVYLYLDGKNKDQEIEDMTQLFEIEKDIQ